MTNKKGHTLQHGPNTKPEHDNSKAAQRQRLAAALLALGRVPSVYAREELNCYHPNARVMELRRQGWDIVTEWEHHIDAFGRKHRVGVWVLRETPEAQAEAA